MNREQHLQKTFPLEDGTTYIQNLDNVMCEYSGLPSVQSYEPKGAGVGGESLKENFIDSNQAKSNVDGAKSNVDGAKSNEVSSDWMYNWIRKHSKK
jgi:hypothetical protein